MLATSNGRFVNPFRVAQVCEKLGNPGRKFYNFDEWELPQGASAEMAQGEPTISFPQELSGQLNRIYARYVWSKEIPGHLNPGAPEEGAGRLCQFEAKLSFGSGLREGYQASISCVCLDGLPEIVVEATTNESSSCAPGALPAF